MDLEASILEVFCVDGLLHREVPEYVERYQQIEMAIAIASALEQKSNALIEAGTGTGKTFAYLVPILLQKKKCDCLYRYKNAAGPALLSRFTDHTEITGFIPQGQLA